MAFFSALVCVLLRSLLVDVFETDLEFLDAPIENSVNFIDPDIDSP